MIATGTGNLEYQWFLNTTNLLVGATNDMFTITNAQGKDSGIYQVAVSNTIGTATSSGARSGGDAVTR